MIPNTIKIYHIVHIDRLNSIISDGFLLSDRMISQRINNGSMIGLSNIKQRRLNELTLNSYSDLYVGDCVPFYFCPRSVMLYLIYSRDPELAYQEGQEQIIHLQADFHQVIDWANDQNIHWAFTTSNAGSYYFNDFNNLNDLNKIDWNAVQARQWQNCKEGKQAEFLLAHQFPWYLIERIGVYSNAGYHRVMNIMQNTRHRPHVEVIRSWYY